MSSTIMSSMQQSTTNSQVSVKQERHDDAEINELAAKLIEAHKAQNAKAALQQQQQVPRALNQQLPASGPAGQTNIMNYLTRKPGTITPVTVMNTKTEDTVNGEKKASDEESVKGHFGWETFPGKIYIPYIVRQNEKYCAVRMVEMKLLNKYLNYLHQDIYSCTCVRSYYITEAESRLFNEINTKHCDMQFGREMFTLKDLVVRLSDASKFFHFLDVCYKKLLMGCSTPNDKCGFIRINKESVVPYTVRDTQKMVPLFYFEGETDNLKLKADYLSGWDLSYLKFCCKVQGIRNELFASDSVAVISLTDIKGYFPPGTDFEDYWPSKVVDSQLLSGPKTNNTVHWTRQPAQPPPKPTIIMNNIPKQMPQVRKPAGNIYQNMQQQQNLQKTNNNIPDNISQAVQRALSNNWNTSNHGILSPAQQEQLLRMTQLQQVQQQAQQQAQLRHAQNMGPIQQYNNYMGASMLMSRTSQNQAVPPPLVRSSQSQVNHMSNMSNAALGQALQHQQKRVAPGNMTNGRSATTITSSSVQRSNNVMQQQMQDMSSRLIMLPEMQMTGTSYKPYHVQKQVIENKSVYCINKNPYVNSEYLMTIADLKDTFFPYITIDVCRRVLNALDISLFKGNRLQYQTLQEAGRSNVDNMPLVQVTDVMQYMLQLDYMVRGHTQDTNANKRARIS